MKKNILGDSSKSLTFQQVRKSLNCDIMMIINNLSQLNELQKLKENHKLCQWTDIQKVIPDKSLIECRQIWECSLKTFSKTPTWTKEVCISENLLFASKLLLTRVTNKYFYRMMNSFDQLSMSIFLSIGHMLLIIYLENQLVIVMNVGNKFLIH